MENILTKRGSIAKSINYMIVLFLIWAALIQQRHMCLSFELFEQSNEIAEDGDLGNQDISKLSNKWYDLQSYIGDNDSKFELYKKLKRVQESAKQKIMSDSSEKNDFSKYMTALKEVSTLINTLSLDIHNLALQDKFSQASIDTRMKEQKRSNLPDQLPLGHVKSTKDDRLCRMVCSKCHQNLGLRYAMLCWKDCIHGGENFDACYLVFSVKQGEKI